MIEVGEYVRTKDGIIDKVIIDYKGECNNPNCSEKHISCETDYYCEKEIVKHSKDIINLIEIGDVVEIIDVLDQEVYYIWDKEMLDAVKEDIKIGLKLKRILTKEQLDKNCYVVEG